MQYCDNLFYITSNFRVFVLVGPYSELEKNLWYKTIVLGNAESASPIFFLSSLYSTLHDIRIMINGWIVIPWIINNLSSILPLNHWDKFSAEKFRYLCNFGGCGQTYKSFILVESAGKKNYNHTSISRENFLEISFAVNPKIF